MRNVQNSCACIKGHSSLRRSKLNKYFISARLFSFCSHLFLYDLKNRCSAKKKNKKKSPPIKVIWKLVFWPLWTFLFYSGIFILLKCPVIVPEVLLSRRPFFPCSQRLNHLPICLHSKSNNWRLLLKWTHWIVFFCANHPLCKPPCPPRGVHNEDMIQVRFIKEAALFS